MPLVIELPLPTPSLNQLLRWHWSRRCKLRDQYEILLRSAMSPGHRVKAGDHRRVHIARLAVRQLDHDNLVGGCKTLVDALARARLIWDDSPEFVSVAYSQRKAKAREVGTVVTVY